MSTRGRPPQASREVTVRTIVKGKNFDVSDGVRAYTERKLSRLERMLIRDPPGMSSNRFRPGSRMPRQPLVQARHQCGAASTGANRNERPAPGGAASELTEDPSKQISEEARLVLLA